MYIWFIWITIIYYVVLFGWYRFRRNNPVKEKEASSSKSLEPKTLQIKDIIGASTYTKRKETQTNARTTTAVENVNQVVENTPIFAEPIEKAPSGIVPVAKLDQAFSDTVLTAEEEAELEGEESTEGQEARQAMEKEEVDWVAEEEELSQYRASGEEETNYASGISFEELGRLGTLLQKEAVNEEELVEAGEALQKIAGTTLLDSVLSALPDSLKRVSELIDAQLQQSRKGNEMIPEWMNFDIKNFT